MPNKFVAKRKGCGVMVLITLRIRLGEVGRAGLEPAISSAFDNRFQSVGPRSRVQQVSEDELIKLAPLPFGYRPKLWQQVVDGWV